MGCTNSWASQGAADKVVSDAVSMAMLLGTALGVAMYAAAPWLLERIAGPASAAVVAPALVYVRIRCAKRPLAPALTRGAKNKLRLARSHLQLQLKS